MVGRCFAMRYVPQGWVFLWSGIGRYTITYDVMKKKEVRNNDSRCTVFYDVA